PVHGRLRPLPEPRHRLRHLRIHVRRGRRADRHLQLTPNRRTGMKRVILTAVVGAAVAAGCGGPKSADPKVTGGKEDPRIKRAEPGGPATQGVAPLKKPSAN